MPSSSNASIQDKPYKPKFHKAAFYHNTGNANSTISISESSDPKMLLKKSFKEKLKDDEMHSAPQYQPLVIISILISGLFALLTFVYFAVNAKRGTIEGAHIENNFEKRSHNGRR